MFKCTAYNQPDMELYIKMQNKGMVITINYSKIS